jgi:putative hemolysin
MSWLALFWLVLLAAIVTLASYMRRVYSEFGKILSREVQENLDAWEERVEPRLGLTREHAALCAAVLEQLALVVIALEIGALLFDRSLGPPTTAEVAQAVLGVVLVIVICAQLLPSLLFNRTRGAWAERLVWPIRLLLWMTTPATAFIRFFFSVAALAEHPVGVNEEPAADVEALIEAGEEEGILERSDSDLVRSAVEFGDMLVREVMTPRPRVFAVEASLTLERFLELLREHNYSRVPVYEGLLDNVTGIAFAHDLLQITDAEARTRKVGEIQRAAEFVPETKRGYELLREMQREKQHMRIVIDEYGAVAGLVTIEDLLEQIVGRIQDEHEDGAGEEPQREPSGAWVAPGSFPVDQLADLIGEPVDLDEGYEATTLGGLASEIEGRIPVAGEEIRLEPAGLRLEVMAATDHRVERLRVYPPSLTRSDLAGESRGS